MTETEPPRQKQGQICPLFKKDVSKVCHTCKFYHALTVSKPGEPQNTYLHWDCAFNFSVMLGRDIGAAVNGLQQATEGFRNETSKQNQSNLHSIQQVLQQNGRIAQALLTVAEAQDTQNRLSNGHTNNLLGKHDDDSPD